VLGLAGVVLGAAMLGGGCKKGNETPPARAASEEKADRKENPQTTASFLQWTLRYCVGEGLEVGDWTRYRLARPDGRFVEVMLRVDRAEAGGLWIIEESGSQTRHMLFDPESRQLTKGRWIDEDRTAHTLPVIERERLADLFEGMKQEVTRAGSPIAGWEPQSGTETVEVPAGSFACSFLEPAYTEEATQRYVEQGLSPEDIAASKNTSRFYFSPEVPRLIPTQIAFAWWQYVEAFDRVEGGLVRSPQAMPYELAAYGRGRE